MKPIKRMKPSDKKTWTTALRSRKFKQGNGSLISDEGSGVKHCCLGVAQTVLGERAPSEGACMLRPGRFGISGKVQTALAGANDSRGKGDYADVKVAFEELGTTLPKARYGRITFGAIADWIDKHL